MHCTGRFGLRRVRSFSCVMGVNKMGEKYGLLTEEKVLEELIRRRLPCQQRVHIGDLEVDILVGQRICVEVDGYYHAMKGKISKDAAKEKQLESLGYVVLRITSFEVKNRRRLREFASKVQEAYERERSYEQAQRDTSLTHSLPQEKLQQLRAQLEAEKAKQKKKQPVKARELTEEELFFKAVEDLSKRGRK